MKRYSMCKIDRVKYGENTSVAKAAVLKGKRIPEESLRENYIITRLLFTALHRYIYIYIK